MLRAQQGEYTYIHTINLKMYYITFFDAFTYSINIDMKIRNAKINMDVLYLYNFKICVATYGNNIIHRNRNKIKIRNSVADIHESLYLTLIIIVSLQNIHYYRHE